MSFAFLLVFVVLPLISSTRASTCVIEGVNIAAGNHELAKPINDTYRGVLEVFQMTNVLRVNVKGDTYFNVIWNRTTLTLATGDNFDKYEAEVEPSIPLAISVALSLECTEDNDNHMMFTQRIIDTNNHAPQLNQAKLEYAFGPSIPKDLILTDLLPIKATDGDITNRQLSFEMPQNEFFMIENTVYQYTKKEYAPKLTALKDIPAPFSQEFELNVTDSGVPPLQTRALITVRVVKPSDIILMQNTSEAHHPPVFGKNFYMAYYNNVYQIEMEDVITIRYGLTNITTVNITKHYQYFNASLKNDTVTIRAIRTLPQEIILEGFIVVELEALNEGVSSPGRTALLIEFSDMMISSECHIFIFGYSMGYPTVLFSSAILAILLINVCVLAIFFNKQRKPTSEKY